MRGQSGFALPLVLWMIALLVAGVAWMAQSSSTQAIEVKALAQRVQGEAAARAGIELALRQLDPRLGSLAWRADGKRHAVSFDERRLEITLRDEGSKLDINAGDSSLLRAALVRSGMPSDQVERLAEGIAAVRQASVLRQTGFQEAAKTKTRFFSVAALAQLPAASPDAVAMVAPELTVFTGASRPDPAAGKGVGSDLYDIESIALRGNTVEGRIRVIVRVATGYDGGMTAQWLAWEHGQWAPAELQ